MPQTDRNIIKKSIKYIKALPQGRNWGEVLIFLFFLVASAIFWLLQTLQQVTDTQINIPVTYVNQSSRIAIKDSLPDAVRVKVLDKAATLLAYSVNKRNKTIEVDLSQLSESNNSYTVSSLFLETECARVLPSSSKLLSISPMSITIQALPLKEKTVPVVLDGNIIPAKGFMLTDTIQLTPSEVVVYGPESMLDTLMGISTKRINKENLEKNTSFLVDLSFPSSLKASVQAVDVKVMIEESTEKMLEIPIVAKGFPANYILRTFPLSVQLYCRLPLSRYGAVNAGHFEASVYYHDAIADSSSTVPVVITKKPEWVNENYRFTPEKVEYLIEQAKIND